MENICNLSYRLFGTYTDADMRVRTADTFDNLAKVGDVDNPLQVRLDALNMTIAGWFGLPLVPRAGDKRKGVRQQPI